MNTYISLLRGINVSGKNKIKMESLRETYRSLGYTNVVSYIQSGNVVFETPNDDVSDLEATIRKAIADTYGYDVELVMKTGHDMADVISLNPFSTRPSIDPKKLCVIFLRRESPSLPAIDASKIRNDEYVIMGRQVYLYCPDGFGRTKLTNAFWEKIMSTIATSRNWNTVNKLLEMATNLPSD